MEHRHITYQDWDPCKNNLYSCWIYYWRRTNLIFPNLVAEYLPHPIIKWNKILLTVLWFSKIITIMCVPKLSVFSSYLYEFIALILRELEETFKVLILKQKKLRVKKMLKMLKVWMLVTFLHLSTFCQLTFWMLDKYWEYALLASN